MHPHLARTALAFACLLASAPLLAAKVQRIEVRGLADEDMADNVRVSLSLHDELNRELRPRRLRHLLRVATDEARQALEPFGYYSPTITVRRSDGVQLDGATSAAGPDAGAAADAEADAGIPPVDDDPDAQSNVPDADAGKSIDVIIEIQPGEPVRVRRFNFGISGPGGTDATVASAGKRYTPQPGEVLDHTLYEAGKHRVNRALREHGYFDAELLAHRVEVTRADHAADIDLRWNSGPRYAMGPAHFSQVPEAVIGNRLLSKLVNWDVGEPYDEAYLDRLRRSLVSLDYFALVDVQAKPDEAEALQVPVAVELAPAKRSIYTVGASYGTLDGAGVSLGVERRYLNQRGHKALAQIDWAQKRKAATLQYRMPAFAWLDGWYTASLQAVDEQTSYVNSRRLEFVASRSGQFNDYLNLVASLHVLRERWAYYTVTKPVEEFQYASFVYPSLRGEYVDVDNRMEPRRGMGGTLTLRGGKGGANGDTVFGQLHATAQWFHGFDANSRLIVRGELGHTFTDDVLALPPSLRFYAGGDRSVRGYGWHEIGPRVRTPAGDYFTGAPNVVTASVEYERYIRGPWGFAVFADSGSAFSGRKPDMHTGVGVGLRWRSPVGPVRIDIARGLNAPDSPITLHLNIGADL